MSFVEARTAKERLVDVVAGALPLDSEALTVLPKCLLILWLSDCLKPPRVRRLAPERLDVDWIVLLVVLEGPDPDLLGFDVRFGLRLLIDHY